MSNLQGYEKSAHLYDLFDNKDNINFFKRYSKKVDNILDVGAGTRRIAIPLAKEGKVVYCVEPSNSMIKKIRERRDEHFCSNLRLI